jgi:hypothetical protein
MTLYSVGEGGEPSGSLKAEPLDLPSALQIAISRSIQNLVFRPVEDSLANTIE